MKKKLKNIRLEDFSKNVLMLVGSTAFSQGLAILILPILTRIYSPESFGYLGVYTSIVSIFAASACLRYDIAIGVVKEDSEANIITLISLALSFIFSSLAFLVVYIFNERISNLIDNQGFNSYLYLIPVGIFFFSSFNALQFWKSRKKQFKEIAIVRFKQVGVGSAFQLIGGWFSGGLALYLIIGYILSTFSGIFKFYADFIKSNKGLYVFSNIIHVMKKYKQYPKYSTLESFLNNVSIFFPLLLISKYVSIAETGFIMLAMKLMQIPMTLIGNSIAQVFLVSAAKEYHDGKIADFTLKTVVNLFKIGTGPILFIGIVAPEVCQIVFGSSWERVGVLINWMVAWFVMQFLASPIAMIFHITENQKYALLIQLVNLFMRVFPLLIFVYLEIPFLPEVYAVTGFLFYFIFYFWSLKLAGVNYISLLKLKMKNLYFILPFLLLGLLLKLSLSYWVL